LGNNISKYKQHKVTDNKYKDTSKDIVVVKHLENIESTIEGQIIRSGARSANIFKHFKSDLEIMYHHGSIVTNYMLQNIPTKKYWNNIIGCNI
jgi:hypothetical protein